MPKRGPTRASLLKDLDPRAGRAAREVVAAFAHAAPEMKREARAAWQARFVDLYGGLSGQRSLEKSDLAEAYPIDGNGASLHDLILALQTYFVLLADLIALSAIEEDPLAHLRGLREASDGELLVALRRISSGLALESHRVFGATQVLALDWYVDRVDRALSRQLRELLAVLAGVIERSACFHEMPDPMQFLYGTLMPKNLLHVLGEFYTPFWLAELLLEDAGYRPGLTVVDPFGGSGIFLLAAVRKARQAGSSGLAVLPHLGYFDLNPVACAAARTNLVLALASEIRQTREPVRLPVVCADSLTPASGVRLPEGFDLLATNPPWIGWEYMSRPYRAKIEPAWARYTLFTAKGRDAAFLKEDLSTLALVAACDAFLRDGGTCVAVLRPSVMTSTLAGKGLRRLSIYPDRDPLRLDQVRCFAGFRVFSFANAHAVTWKVTKGIRTEFPIPVARWRAKTTSRRPSPEMSLSEIRARILEEHLAAQRTVPGDDGSPWTVGTKECLAAVRRCEGPCAYRARTGVFTGGGNAVYYLTADDEAEANGERWFRNVTERAKRKAESVRVRLETPLVYEVVRGRDLHRWHVRPEQYLLCPHTPATKINAIPPEQIQRQYPLAFAYLSRMREVLEGRKGFAGWEKQFHREAFYAIQRIGDYTFAPYKVAWRYIASDFLVAVVGPDAAGRPRICNDKVMFVGLDCPGEAHYLCALLTSSPVRWQVVSTVKNTQISTSAIRNIPIPRFDPAIEVHRQLSAACRRGHAHIAQGKHDQAEHELREIDRLAGQVLGFRAHEVDVFAAELRRREGAVRRQVSSS